MAVALFLADPPLSAVAGSPAGRGWEIGRLAKPSEIPRRIVGQASCLPGGGETVTRNRGPVVIVAVVEAQADSPPEFDGWG